MKKALILLALKKLTFNPLFGLEVFCLNGQAKKKIDIFSWKKFQALVEQEKFKH